MGLTSRGLWPSLEQCVSGSLLALILSTILQAGKVSGVRCFCDTRNCEDALCDGQWCLVGFQSDVRLVQNCGTESARALSSCATDWNGWDEVCSCQEDFCNTFSFLRAMMKRRKPGSGGDGRGGAGGGGVSDSDAIVFQHQPPDIESRPLPPNYPYQSNQLILLLVVIPLGVGALAVCLVFVNYHCKMC